MSSKPGNGVQTAAWQKAGIAANRQNRARADILAALRRLGIPQDRWPEFVRDYGARQGQHTRFRQRLHPPPFVPPAFDPLNQSTGDWVKAADAEWAKHRDQYLERREFWRRVGEDSEIPPSKQARVSGKTSSVTQRYDWAAMRLCGYPWKEIAAIHQLKESMIIKAATAVLEIADWPTKL
ncbi:MAG: hypothetical protein WBW58_06030 [Candidatus Acidiferrum sp.]